MSEAPAAGSGSGEAAGPKADEGGRRRIVRVLFVQSSLGAAGWITKTFARDRFHLTFGNDALTVVATAAAHEIDLIVLDTPLFDLDIEPLLGRLDSERLRIPVIVLGEPPTTQPPKVSFPLRYVRKPVVPAFMLWTVDLLLREAQSRKSIPPLDGPDRVPDAAAAGAAPASYEDLSGFASEVSAEVVSDASAAAPEAIAKRVVGGPTTIPPGPEYDRVVALERVLIDASHAAAPMPIPAEFRRRAIIADDDHDGAECLRAAIESAGLAAEILRWSDCATLDPIRRSPPDLLIAGIDAPAQGRRFVSDVRLDARLRNVPLVVVSSSSDALDAVRMLPPPAVEVLRRAAPEREIAARIGSLLAPFEQTRERIIAEKMASGEIAPLGAVAVLRIVAETRPAARIVLRGDGRLIELDVTDGAITGISLTEADGRHRDDAGALHPVVAMRAGRYSVRPQPRSGPPGPHRLPIPEALWEAADRITDLLRCTVSPGLERIERVKFEEPYGTARGLSLVEIRIRARLHGGDSPRTAAGIPGATIDVVGRLLEKLILAGEVIALEGPAPQTAEAAATPSARRPTPPATAPPVRIAEKAPSAAGQIAAREKPPAERAEKPVEKPSPGPPAKAAVKQIGTPPTPAKIPTLTLEEALIRRGGRKPESPQEARPAAGQRTELSAVSALIQAEIGEGGGATAPASVQAPPADVAAGPAAQVAAPPPAAAPAPAGPQPPPLPAAPGAEPAPEEQILEVTAVPDEPAAAPPPLPARAVAEPPAAVEISKPAASPEAVPRPPPPPPAPRRTVPPPAGATGRLPRVVAVIVAVSVGIALAAGGALVYLEYGRASPAAEAGPESERTGAATKTAASTTRPTTTATKVAREAPPPDATVLREAAVSAPDATSAAIPDAAAVREALAPTADAATGAAQDARDASLLSPAPDAAAPRDVAGAPRDATTSLSPGATSARDTASPLRDAVAVAAPDARDAAHIPPPPRDVSATRDAGPARDAAAVRDTPARPDRAPPPPPPPPSASGRATLVLPQPEGIDVEIRVTVGDVSRGSLPVTLELDPGDYELRFEAAGRRSLSLVHLEPGQRKVVTPRQLLHQLDAE